MTIDSDGTIHIGDANNKSAKRVDAAVDKNEFQKNVDASFRRVIALVVGSFVFCFSNSLGNG